MEHRKDWVDYGKGIGIILVVYAHLLSSGFHAQLKIQEHFLLSDSIVYSFHMPLFFFLAGLFVAQSYKKRGASAFLVNKLKYLAYPYLIWSFLQGSIELFFSGHSHRGITGSDILGIPYLPLAQFWFLYALFWMYVAYAVLNSLGRFAPAGMVAAALVLFFFPINTEIMALHGFATGFIFFVFGIFANEYFGEMEKYILPIWATGAFFPVFIGVAWYIFESVIAPTRLTDGSHPFYFLFLAVSGITLCIGLAQYFSRQKCFHFIQILGIYSLQIYLVHMLAGVGARIILVNFFHVENPVLHMFIGVSAGLLVPILVYKTALKAHFPFLFEPGKVAIRAGL
jgi:fucose 4-O-acetylase-like acetyltransferase